MQNRRGQISIDKIVALRSSVLPMYVIIRPDGGVVTSDEVSETGTDFLTTRMHGEQISFQSIHGDYLSAAGGSVCTRRFCGADERFTVEKMDTKYAFRARSGKYLSALDHSPWVDLGDNPGETEQFQLFSLMMGGVNVGKQLEMLERNGMVTIDGLLDEEQLAEVRQAVTAEGAASPQQFRSHETRVSGLATRAPCLAALATHPIIMHLARRVVSPVVRLSEVESCQTSAEFVRKELEQTTWHVVHPYSSVEFPGVVDPRISFTATWFLDALDAGNSTWAWAKAPLCDGAHLPKLPQLSAPEEVDAVSMGAKSLTASAGSVWMYLGPVWMSNTVGAGSFWKEYDAQTRYKHLSGQKTANFRALTDAQQNAQPRDGQSPTLVQATYVREYVMPRTPAPPFEELARLPESERQQLEQLFAM
jgi:hypothetical protein